MCQNTQTTYHRTLSYSNLEQIINAHINQHCRGRRQRILHTPDLLVISGQVISTEIYSTQKKPWLINVTRYYKFDRAIKK